MIVDGNAGDWGRYIFRDTMPGPASTQAHQYLQIETPLTFFGGELVWKSWSANLADRLDVWLARASYSDNLTNLT